MNRPLSLHLSHCLSNHDEGVILRLISKQNINWNVNEILMTFIMKRNIPLPHSLSAANMTVSLYLAAPLTLGKFCRPGLSPLPFSNLKKLTLSGS